jgi:hypothetical protein
MMTDEIIREVWQAKDELAKKFDYNIEALVAELQKRQKESGRKVVNFEQEQNYTSPAISTNVKPS